MILYGHSSLEEIIESDQSNKLCFDCLKNKSSWASINNGTFICGLCAIDHRKYGKSISFIKSLQVDLWKDSEVSMLSYGGNKRLLGLLEIYEIDIRKINKKEFYFSRLADFYRKLIKSEFDNLNIDLIMPLKEEAMKSFDVDKPIDNNVKLNPFYKKTVNKDDKKSSADSTSVNSKAENASTLSKNKKEGFINNINSWIGGAYVSTFNTFTLVPDVLINSTNKITNTIFDKSIEFLVSNFINLL